MSGASIALMKRFRSEFTITNRLTARLTRFDRVEGLHGFNQ